MHSQTSRSEVRRFARKQQDNHQEDTVFTPRRLIDAELREFDNHEEFILQK